MISQQTSIIFTMFLIYKHWFNSSISSEVWGCLAKSPRASGFYRDKTKNCWNSSNILLGESPWTSLNTGKKVVANGTRMDFLKKFLWNLLPSNYRTKNSDSAGPFQGSYYWIILDRLDSISAVPELHSYLRHFSSNNQLVNCLRLFFMPH